MHAERVCGCELYGDAGVGEGGGIDGIRAGHVYVGPTLFQVLCLTQLMCYE